MILTEAQARQIIEAALAFATAGEVRVTLAGGRSGNTRFALNSVTTCGDQDTLDIVVQATFGKRHGTATGTELDDASLRKVVEAAEAVAKVSPEDPEYVPELGPQQYPAVEPYADATSQATPELGVRAANAAIEPAIEHGLTASGYFDHNHGFTAMGNSKGLFGYYRRSGASYTATARTPDGTGSGWAGCNSHDIGALDYAAIGRRAIEKSEASKDPVALEPGVYPVILEPAAVGEFLRFAIWCMRARNADEGRSFFSKAGGGNKIGEAIAGNNVTLISDPFAPDMPGAPFDGEGLPAQKTTWIENGVLRRLWYDRYWAQKQGAEPTGPPAGLILQGGGQSLDELIAGTGRAVLITRFWYIRFLDPQTILLTGLTRDGLFLIENGAIKHSVKNFRFNESPIAVLGKVTGLSKPVRVGDALMPAVRASEFTFSSSSDSV